MNWGRTLRGSHTGRAEKHTTRKEAGKKHEKGGGSPGWGEVTEAGQAFLLRPEAPAHWLLGEVRCSTVKVQALPRNTRSPPYR